MYLYRLVSAEMVFQLVSKLYDRKVRRHRNMTNAIAMGWADLFAVIRARKDEDIKGQESGCSFIKMRRVALRRFE